MCIKSDVTLQIQGAYKSITDDTGGNFFLRDPKPTIIEGHDKPDAWVSNERWTLDTNTPILNVRFPLKFQGDYANKDYSIFPNKQSYLQASIMFDSVSNTQCTINFWDPFARAYIEYQDTTQQIPIVTPVYKTPNPNSNYPQLTDLLIQIESQIIKPQASSLLIKYPLYIPSDTALLRFNYFYLLSLTGGLVRRALKASAYNIVDLSESLWLWDECDESTFEMVIPG